MGCAGFRVNREGAALVFLGTVNEEPSEPCSWRQACALLVEGACAPVRGLDELQLPDLSGRARILMGSDPERTIRTHAHLALASILLAFVAPLISWTLWLADRGAPPGPWKRRLLALAILDTALMLGFGAAAVVGFDLGAAAREPPRIGVALDANDPPGGVVVARVAPDSPAAVASIREGDRIVALDGKPIERNRELVAAIAGGDAAERHVTVVREGQSVALVVRPSASAPKFERSRQSLFAPIDTEDALGREDRRRLLVGAGGIELVLVGSLSIMARRRGARAGPGLAVLTGLLTLTLTSSVVLLAFKMTIGVSLGALLVALLSGSLALLVVGLVAVKVPKRTEQVWPPMSTVPAIALGVLYGLAGSARIAMLITILVAVFGLPMHSTSETFGLDSAWGPIGVGLFLATTVIVAPVAEEVLFRGVLLPWLARWMAPTAALAWSAVVFALGHAYYGVGALLIAHYGLVFGWARLRTGKLWAPMALHALLNGTTAAALLVNSS